MVKKSILLVLSFTISNVLYSPALITQTIREQQYNTNSKACILKHLAPTEMAASLRVPRKLCSILFFNVLFLTLLLLEILGFITYSWEELLDIRATSTHQYYNQEYDFPEADPLFGPPPRTMDRIPAGNPKQWRRRRG
jgi:hypothetical protein